MEVRKLVVLMLIVFSISLISSENCSIVERQECDADYMVPMELSDISNAHVLVGYYHLRPTYDFVLCCDFRGKKKCDGMNKIIGASSRNNSHVQGKENLSYPEHVCYGNLVCKAEEGSCSEEYDLHMLSLSDFSNAHVGFFDEYGIKVCCRRSFESMTFWTNLRGDYIGEIDISVDDTQVLLNFINTDLNEGDEVLFQIYEPDSWTNSLIGEIEGVADENGDVVVSWTIRQDVIDSAKDSAFEGEELDPIYFKVSGEHPSNDLMLNFLDEFYCTGVDFCRDYTSAELCNSDPCNNAYDSISADSSEEDLVCGIGNAVYDEESGCSEYNNCECEWDGECKPTYGVARECEDESLSLSIGSCRYSESTEDNCSDGFLTYTYEGIWEWDSNNSLTENPQSDDYIQIDGIFRYDPVGDDGKRTSERCSSGSTSVKCPAKIQLPFFNFYSFMLAVMLVSAIYFVLIFNKNVKSFYRSFILKD